MQGQEQLLERNHVSPKAKGGGPRRIREDGRDRGWRRGRGKLAYFCWCMFWKWNASLCILNINPFLPLCDKYFLPEFITCFMFLKTFSSPNQKKILYIPLLYSRFYTYMYIYIYVCMCVCYIYTYVYIYIQLLDHLIFFLKNAKVAV